MIGNVNIRVSAGHVNLPLPPVAVFKDSAASVIIEGVQAARDGIVITTVKLAVVNAAGTTLTTSAKLTGKNWTATVPATHFAAAGSTRKGVTVFCGGTDENGTAREWNLGTGDLVVISCDSTAVNLGEYTNLRLMDAQPATPHKGDLVKISGGYKIYNGSAWESLGGSASAVTSVNNKTGAVTLDYEDVGALAEDGTAAKAEKLRNTATWQEAEVVHDDASVPRVTVYDRSLGDPGTVVGRCAYTNEIPTTAAQVGALAASGTAVAAVKLENGVYGKAEIAAVDSAIRIKLSQTGVDLGVLAYLAEVYYDLKSTATAKTNSVTYLSLGADDTITITPPAAVEGKTRDWVVYVYAAADKTATLDPGSTSTGNNKWFSSDASGVTGVSANKLTMFCCTEFRPPAEGVNYFAVNKVELEEVS